jgi:hypothetical protein
MGLSCWPIALAQYHPYCLHTCTSTADCTDYRGPTCCMTPGPQTVETHCVPMEILDGGCP